MKRFILIIVLLLLSVAFAPQVVHHAFLPFTYSSRTDGLGMHIEIGSGTGNASGLTALHVHFVRNIFGDDQELSVYQVYKVGGWSAVDAMVLPDINSIEPYATPLVEFTHGGICKVPSLAQLALYADFIVEFVERYDIKYFSVFNEPDSKGGNSGLSGCFGDQHTSRLIYLINQVRETLPADHKLGVSFLMGDTADLAMFNATVPYLDWVGVHHYGRWQGGVVVEPYPGTLDQLYDLVAPLDIPIYLTEVNVRDPLTICSPAFRQAQAEYNLAAMQTDFDAKIILVYAGGSNWQCTGIKGSLTEQYLLPGGYP